MLLAPAAFSLTAADRVAQFAGFGFDAGVWEIFTTLTGGASLHIIPAEIRPDILKLDSFYRKHAITSAFLATQVCEGFIEKVEKPSIRLLMAGGDKLNRFKRGNYELFNLYGPTEDMVATTSHLVTEMAPNIPIGGPIDNNGVFILQKGGHNYSPSAFRGNCVFGGTDWPWGT